MKKQMVSVFFALSAFIGSAQAASVAGKVSDFNSGKALSSVTVVVHVGDDRYTAKTNSSGTYYVDIPDSRLGQKAVIYVKGVKGKTFYVKESYALNFKFR